MNTKIRSFIRLEHFSFASILVGTISAIIASHALLAVLTSLIISGKINVSANLVGVNIVRLFSVLLGVLIGTALLKEKQIVVSTLITTSYILILSTIGIVVFDGSISGTVFGAVSSILGGAIGLLIGKKLQIVTPRKHKTRR